ncbi:MAG: hypothetical protein HQ483_09590 [Rhodospirillales bacterium]|nr:hypothetical protein [Rhodospirillales bacterium]
MNPDIESWWQCPYRSEPTIAEMLNDPIVHLVMARDNVRGQEVSDLIRDMAMRLGLTAKQAA